MKLFQIVVLNIVNFDESCGVWDTVLAVCSIGLVLGQFWEKVKNVKFVDFFENYVASSS